MSDVVAIDLPGGPDWVTELRRAWDRGEAVAAVDRRLGTVARAEQMAALAPTIIVDEGGRRRARDGHRAEPGDALIVTTSGTTGRPRASVLTHDAVRAAATATSNAIGADPAADRWLACLPLAHVGGLGVVTRALLTGTALEVHDGFDADAVEAAARAGATLTSLVPTVLDRIDPASFRLILLGGSAIPGERPSNSVATYGLTETAGGVVYDGLPLEAVEVRIVDGEIQIRCPMLLRTYRDGNDPRLTDGWFPTGDGGTFDGGELRVHGRLDDVIVTGGEKVWPASVEAALATHPAIESVAVVGRPDPAWGQQVTALVEINDGATPPSLDELREAVKRSLPPWCAPRAVEVVETLPRTALGKIRRDGRLS